MPYKHGAQFVLEHGLDSNLISILKKKLFPNVRFFFYFVLFFEYGSLLEIKGMGREERREWKRDRER